MRRREGKVSADKAGLCARLELAACCLSSTYNARIVFRAPDQSPAAAVNHGVGLEKRDHPLDVARPLAGNQQPLQILRIERRLTVCLIGHELLLD